MEFRFYLLLLAIYIIYDNNNFIKILLGKKTEQLVLEHDNHLESISNDYDSAKKIFGRQMILYISICVYLINIVSYLSYFALSIFCFRNTLFLICTLVIIIWWLIYLPSEVRNYVKDILNPDNILEYESVKGIKFWLRDGFFSTHALLVIIMVFWIPV